MAVLKTIGDSPIPARAGVGLKPAHYRDILDGAPDIGWFEIHAENYMGDGGPPHAYLTAIRERYPLSLHGVGLSIGGAGPLDKAHLMRLRGLLDRYGLHKVKVEGILVLVELSKNPCSR